MSANEDLFDAQLRHAIGVRRLSSGEVARILALLRKSDEELLEKLGKRLKPGDFTSVRYKKLLKDVTEFRRDIFMQILQSNREELLGLAKAEQEFTKGMMDFAVPVQLDYAVATSETLRTLVTATPFAGGANAARTLSEWWSRTSVADQKRITDAIQLGMVQQEGVPDIVRRVTQSVELTRRNAEAVVRTAVNHVSNSAREAFFNANEEVVFALRWTSTLDGRTTAICRARDGHFAPIGDKEAPKPQLDPPGARPPALPNCRSVMAGVLDPEGIEQKMPERPFVRDARTRRQREMDFRAEAHAKVGDKRWKGMSVAERNGAIKQLRQDWVKENVGTVPGETTYDSWMRKQPTAFQNEVLGVKKAQAFRKGLHLDQFVDKRGTELNLKQLQEKFPDYIGGVQ